LILTEDPSIQTILNRPSSERLREYKYRFAQCMVFGLPVLALQLFGHNLGGPESARWIGLLQTLLTGWVMYVGAVGMLVEGVMSIAGGKFKPDLVVAALAMILYGLGVAGWIMILRGTGAFFPRAFGLAVLLLICWSGLQWIRMTRAQRA